MRLRSPRDTRASTAVQARERTMTPADLAALIERLSQPVTDLYRAAQNAEAAIAALVQLRDAEAARESIEEFSHAKTDEILRLRADNEHWQDRCLAYQTERDALREFVADMFEAAEWPEGGDIDGGQFQELATKHGILAEEERIAPCEGRESCWCSDYGGPGPTTCYRKAQWLAALEKE